MIVLAAGTLIESRQGTDAARILIYDSVWFSALLILLGINVASAALDRLPWKKKHVGFVITHAGIILVLVGSFITQRTMIDGQMTITEGQTEHRITLHEPILYLFSEKEHRDWIIPLKKRAFAWTGEKMIHASAPSDLSLRLLASYPKAKLHESVERSATGPSAVKVTLHNSFMNQSQWLVEKDPNLSRLSVGPATLQFAAELIPEKKMEVSATSYLEFKFPETTVHIPLEPEMKLPLTRPLEGTPFKITLTRLVKDAVIEGRELRDQAEGKEASSPDLNRAAVLFLEGKDIKEKHTVFAKFPDFPTQHGMQPSVTGAQIYYRLSHSGSRGESHELRFVKQGEKLLYQVQDGLQVKSGEVKLGEDIVTGWMDFQFRVEEYFPTARRVREYTPEPNLSESAVAAIQVEVAKGNETRAFWLGQGTSEEILFGDEKFFFLYGEKRIPAGFRLALRDFRLEQYPGTSRPASFESDVTLRDDARGVSRDVTISMNQPLIWRGFRVYQSGYSVPEEQAGFSVGAKEVSIFSVGRDPGIPVKYGGALVMIAGIMTMFYTRRFSSHAGRIE